MNTTFYRAWLPISLAVHVILLFVLNVVPLGVPQVGGEKSFIPVGIVEAAQPAAVKPPKPEVTPLPEVKPETTSDRVNPNTANQPKLPKTVPPGKQSIDPSITVGNASKPGDGTINKEKGPGIGAKAPPSIMAAKNGTGFAAPPGTDGSMGTGGSTESGVSGPSYGAKSKFGSIFIKGDKYNVDINNDLTALFDVQVSIKGKIAGLKLAKSTGKDSFDKEATNRVMTSFSDFTPAMKNGIPIVWKTHVSVTFSKRGILIEEIQ